MVLSARLCQLHFEMSFFVFSRQHVWCALSGNLLPAAAMGTNYKLKNVTNWFIRDVQIKLKNLPYFSQIAHVIEDMSHQIKTILNV